MIKPNNMPKMINGENEILKKKYFLALSSSFLINQLIEMKKNQV